MLSSNLLWLLIGSFEFKDNKSVRRSIACRWSIKWRKRSFRSRSPGVSHVDSCVREQKRAYKSESWVPLYADIITWVDLKHYLGNCKNINDAASDHRLICKAFELRKVWCMSWAHKLKVVQRLDSNLWRSTLIQCPAFVEYGKERLGHIVSQGELFLSFRHQNTRKVVWDFILFYSMCLQSWSWVCKFAGCIPQTRADVL